MAQPPVNVEVHGLTELRVGAHRLFDRIDHEADAQFKSAADQIALMVRGRVPHVSGRLAASVTAGGGVLSADASVGIGGPGVPYAGWIEFGGTRGRPYVSEGRYLFPTAEAAGPLLQSKGEDAARKEIRGMAWPRPI